MITLFETYNKEPKIGDWVIDISGDCGEILDILVSVTSGIPPNEEWNWVSITTKPKEYIDNNKLYDIKYDANYVNSSKKIRYKAWLNEISDFGSKDDILMIMQTKKYNI